MPASVMRLDGSGLRILFTRSGHTVSNRTLYRALTLGRVGEVRAARVRLPEQVVPLHAKLVEPPVILSWTLQGREPGQHDKQDDTA